MNILMRYFTKSKCKII